VFGQCSVEEVAAALVLVAQAAAPREVSGDAPAAVWVKEFAEEGLRDAAGCLCGRVDHLVQFLSEEFVACHPA